MIAIVDNDVIAKLARYELLDAFKAYVRKAKMTLNLQPTFAASFDLQNKSGTLKKLTAESQRAALAALVDQTDVISLDECGTNLIKCCHLVEGIDPGDAVWLAAAACNPNSIVFTSDKHALHAVASNEACAEIAQRIAGRVVCLEQLFLDLIEQEGIAIIRKQALLDPTVDYAITRAIPNAACNSAQVSQVLNEYITRLRGEAPNLLRP